jgi:predicted transcriptional regulator
MSKIVTLRMDEPVYRTFRILADRENRPLSNFIETAALRYIEEHTVVDEFEMAEIEGNTGLNASLTRAYADMAARRGRFV